MPRQTTTTPITSACRTRTIRVAERAYAAAGREASAHLKKHGNVMSAD